MRFNRGTRAAFLDEVRAKRGNASLIKAFQNSWKASKKQALEYLNDDHLCFPSFYVLCDEISKAGLYDQLNDRCRATMDFLQQQKPEIHGEIQSVHAALKWIVLTGGGDHIDHAYLQKVDIAASILTSVYGDRLVLPSIVGILFFRYRNGLPYHYLVKAIFDIRDPYGLAMVAERLRSAEQAENECARRVLAFVPGIHVGESNDGERHYDSFCRWLEEEGPFLWYKGETFDVTHRPTPYVTVLSAKYLGKFVSVADGCPVGPLTKKERRLLLRFDDLPEGTRKRLADYSAQKRRNDRDEWLEWINRPLKKQVKEAEGGGQRD